MAFKIPSKRHRSSSIATPLARCSSAPRSSPVSHIQPARHTDQQPKKRITLVPPSSRGGSAGPSSPDGSVALTSYSVDDPPLDAGVLAERDAEIFEREDNDSLNEVVMAVDLRDRGTVGCCYYIAREEKLYLIEDVKSGGIEVLDTRKLLWTKSLVIC